MTELEHAPLGPSAAERWLTCPASVHASTLVSHRESAYALEGTTAHLLANIEAEYAFGCRPWEDYELARILWYADAKAAGYDVEAMQEHAAGYVAFLQELTAAEEEPGVAAFFEQLVMTGVEDCWGTADAILLGHNRLYIVDYKYGAGVKVSPANNPQLRLYGLGALNAFGDILDETHEVILSIYQPRAGGGSTVTETAFDLRTWRTNVVVPAAQATRDPDARFVPSQEACRWCPVAGSCRARAEWITAQDFGDPALVTDEELADLVRRLEDIRLWCADIEAEALERTYSQRRHLPGLKVVLSGGKRSIKDAQAAIDALILAGFSPEQISRPQTETLTKLERLVGKQRLTEVLGDLLVKSPGKPSLVGLDDPRPAVDALAAARSDFTVMTSDGE
jgi:uncharacterized protein DUF2800